MSTNALTPWSATDLSTLPANAEPPQIIQRAIQLSDRDQRALVSAFESESYEMAASYAWSRGAGDAKEAVSGIGNDVCGRDVGTHRPG